MKSVEGLTDAQGSLLKEDVNEVFNNGAFARQGLVSVIWYLESLDTAAASRLAGRLSLLCDGSFILNGEFLPGGKIYEIDLLGLQYEEQVVIVEFLLNFLLRCAYQGAFVKDKLTIFVDECQNLNFKSKGTMNILLNESRKLGISMVLAAPKIPTEIRGMSVVEQCGTRLYFTQEGREGEKLAKLIAPTKSREYCKLLSNLRVGECVACGEFQVGGERRTMVKKMGVYLPQ